jgi:hypothetical protein
MQGVTRSHRQDAGARSIAAVLGKGEKEERRKEGNETAPKLPSPLGEKKAATNGVRRAGVDEGRRVARSGRASVVAARCTCCRWAATRQKGLSHATQGAPKT